MKLAGTLQHLRQTVDSLLALADQPGGLYKWKGRLGADRDAVLQAFPAAAQELQTLQAFLQAQRLPTAVVARAGAALQDLQGQVPPLLGQLGQLLQVPQDSMDVPGLLKQLGARLDAWRQAEPSPPDDQGLPFGPQSGLNDDLPPLPLSPNATVTPAPLASGPATPADLARFQAHALLPDLGPDGQTPAGIIRWVYQHVRLQWYGGSAKTPETVLAEQSGNDTDIASLTVALLREAGVPARWGYGVVGLSPADWAALTSLNSSDAAARFLRAAGLPVTTRTDSRGETVRLDVPHTWVEAQLTPGQWVALDVAWKPEQPSGNAQPLPAHFDLNQYLTRGQGRSPLAFWENSGSAAPGAADSPPLDDDAAVPPPPAPAPLADGALPLLTTPIVSGGRTYAALPAEWHGLVQISVGSLYAQISLADLASRRLTLVFLPATTDDQQVADRWRFTDSAPLFLQRVRPLLLLDGQPIGPVSTGGDLAPGETVALHASVQLGVERDSFTRLVHAGDTVGITIAPQPVTEDVSAARIQGAVQTPWTTTESLLGSRLRALGQEYLRRVDRATALVAMRSGVPVVPGVRVALTSFSHKVSYLGDLPLALDYGGVAVDAVRVTNSPVSPSGNDQDERILSLLLAAQESFAEGEVFRPFMGSAGDSTISLLQERTGGGGHLQYLCSCKPGEAPTGLSPAANDRIAQAIAQGYAAIAATTPVGGHDVYVIVDPRTGASGFALGSGNGGLWDKVVGLARDAKEAVLKQILSPLLQRYKVGWATLRGIWQGVWSGFWFGVEGELSGLKSVATNLDGILAVLMDLSDPNNPVRSADLAQRIQPAVEAILQIWDNREAILLHLPQQLEAYIAGVSGYEIGTDEFKAFGVAFAVGFVVGVIAETQVPAWLTGWVGEVLVVPVLTRAARVLFPFVEVAAGSLEEAAPGVVQGLARYTATVGEMARQEKYAEAVAEGLDDAAATAEAVKAGATAMEDLLKAAKALGPSVRAAISRLEEGFAPLRALPEEIQLTPGQEAKWIRWLTRIIESSHEDTSEEARIVQRVLDAYNAAAPADRQVTAAEFRVLRNLPKDAMDADQRLLVASAWFEVARSQGLLPGGWFRKVIDDTKLASVLDPDRVPVAWGFLGSVAATEDCAVPAEFIERLALFQETAKYKAARGVLLMDGPIPDAAEFADLAFRGFPNTGNGFVFGERTVIERQLASAFKLKDGTTLTWVLPDGTRPTFAVLRNNKWEFTGEWETLRARLLELGVEL